MLTDTADSLLHMYQDSTSDVFNGVCVSSSACYLAVRLAALLLEGPYTRRMPASPGPYSRLVISYSMVMHPGTACMSLSTLVQVAAGVAADLLAPES